MIVKFVMVITIFISTPLTIFQELLDQHKIFCLECFFLPSECILLEKHKFHFKLNNSLLRNEISAKSSNSWVKASKKLTVEKNSEYIGKKSLWHSLRIVIFGIQIATKGKIVDYTAANYLYNEIINSGNDDWSYYKDKYQSVFNGLCTEFRKWCLGYKKSLVKKLKCGIIYISTLEKTS